MKDKILKDAKASGFEIIGSQVISDTFHTNITEKLTKFAALVLDARSAVNESCGWFIEDKDGFIEQVFPHIHPPQEGAFKLYTAPQSPEKDAKLKLVKDALEITINYQRKQLNVAIDPLRFYAKQSNWDRDSQEIEMEVRYYNVMYKDTYEQNHVTVYAGLIAKQALEKIGK